MEYKVGDKVWYASFGNREVQIPCPVCYGNKAVIVVLGNGDEVEVECQFCQSGFNAPKGTITEYAHLPEAELVTIVSCRIEQTMDGNKVEYISNRHYNLPHDRIFDTEAEAMECATKMAEKFEQERLDKPKFKNEKSYSWNAGYHLKQARDHAYKVKYHEEKARICKSKAGA